MGMKIGGIFRKTKSVLSGVMGLCLLLLCASCIQPVEDDPVYSVTIDQPQGGAVDASPLSGPAGTTITLTNSPDRDYRFDRYTLDGAAIDGNTFTLNSNVTVSGVFVPTGGEPVVYTVTLTQPQGGAISASPVNGPAGTTITLTNSPGTGGTGLTATPWTARRFPATPLS
jgi:hypothetical protein